MKIGFSGTRAGMSKAQAFQFGLVFGGLVGVTEFHHGGADGADVQAASLVAAHWPDVKRIIHRPEADESPLTRNLRIVEKADILIAAPATDAEVLRSGTWATVRYARKAAKPAVMLSRGAA